MNHGRMMSWWRSALMLALLCIWSIPHLALAGTVPSIPTGPFNSLGQPSTPDYYTTANWANSPPLAKFVDTLPGLGSGKANNLGQYLSVGKPDTVTYPGSDYYEIELIEYKQRMHSDLPLPGTQLRGYVQVNKGTDKTGCGGQTQPACGAADNTLVPDSVHYLGPNLIAQRDRPVRIKFTNKLPLGAAGDLFIPVDTTVMGAGEGPLGAAAGNYTQNRGNIHLHGGRTPWISDGTPHQWITPQNEPSPYKRGVSAQNVPDMPDPGDGSMTYYYTNQQSARLMFYHDHALGITRLNVYAGEAAGYVITDQYEQDLINRGIIPADQIPLIIQEKTFVDATPVAHPVSGVMTPKIRITDPLWNWGSAAPVANSDPALNGARPPVTGDLWMPHVYMPAQTLAAGFGGVNPFGRWMYGPWFYPATVITNGPVPNPYFDADCSSTNPLTLAACQTPGQPTMIPGTPNTSMGMESFQDSAVVNGTAFPTLSVDPRAYRFRILNAASDRFWNLSFYQADTVKLSPDSRLLVAGRSNMTEVKMLSASAEFATRNNWPLLWPVDGRDGGVPDPAFKGPSFLQIGSEGGFLPKPVMIEPQPITYNVDPTAFWVGNVDKMGLALGPAERADVIVDFSAYAGKTLILYNDAPAAWPARVETYDYFTGAADLRDSGGFGTGGTFNKILGIWENGTGPLVGYAPNTRTVMQVIVRSAGSAVDPPYTFSQANLEAEFTAAAPATSLNPAPVKTLFERSQDPIIVGQAAYNTAYPGSYFPPNFPWDGISHINDNVLKFMTLAGENVIVPMEPKGIHDEMGASFDPVYGRMSGNLGMQLPNPTTLNALLILYGFHDIPTETITNSTQVNVTVVPGTTNLADGTQIWKISHNGVDTHPIHFHIFDVQLINRVGWDGQILLPEPNELGWKETIKISPLEDTIVAVRPRAPALPFGINNSVRLLNPSMPENHTMGFSNIDWTTGEAYAAPSPYADGVKNIPYNFGWEYVWHCHILSHEEMDMMRPIVLKYEAMIPPAFAAKATPNGGNVDLSWNDPTPIDYIAYSTFGDPANEVGFNVHRSTDGLVFNKLNATNLLANSTSYTDTTASAGVSYLYKVEAFNPKGSTFSPLANLLTVTVAAVNGPTFFAPATVNLGSTVASLPAGRTIAQVVFYNGITQIGISTTPGTTSTYNWANVPTGTYSVTAKVTDNLGGVAVSAPINVTVTGTLTANFTATGSAKGTDIGFCETVTFTSTSNNSTGSVWTINGINYSTSAVNIAPLALGIYPVTLAVNNSLTGEIAQITKNVSIVNHNPTAIPGGPYNIGPGNALLLNGSGTDTQDACNTTPLTYAWNIDNKGLYDLFTANASVPYSILNTVLGLGTHTITFKVTDSNGGFGTATTTVTLHDVQPPASITVPATSITGNYVVAFAASTTAGVTYTLQESTVANFATFVETVNAVSPVAITGKTGGTYYYRVKAVTAPMIDSIWISGANGCFVPAPLVVGSVTSSLPSPQVKGASITFTAVGQGGSGAYDYKFMIRPNTTPAYTLAQNYGNGNSFIWNTTNLTAGDYTIAVYVKNIGSAVEAVRYIGFTVNTLLSATGVTATTSLPSPQIKGAAITFTATGQGGSGAYDYKFMIRPNTTPAYTLAQNYGNGNSFVWDTTNLTTGDYTIAVYVKNLGSTAAYEAVRYIGFSVNALLSATGVTVTTSLPSPQVKGAVITFTAVGQGGSGSYDYKFMTRPNTTPAYTLAQNYGNGNSFIWDTTNLTAGNYTIAVYVKNMGSTATYEAVRYLGFTVK